MSSTPSPETPDVAALLAPLLQRVAADQRPLLIAIAERRAAERYRGWAGEVGDDAQKARLLACAEREEEIARRVEGLQPDAAVIQQDILAKNPDLEELNRSLFEGRPLDQQFAVQAQGERVGAATWRSLAKGAADGRARDVYLSCAPLEEENAGVLEAILAGR